MWPRLVEALLGLWLLASPLALGSVTDASARFADWIGGSLVLALAALSALRSYRHAHLGTLLVVGGLTTWAWLHFPRPGPPQAQNDILVSLLLAVVAIVPTGASRPPASWRPYVGPRDSDRSRVS